MFFVCFSPQIFFIQSISACFIASSLLDTELECDASALDKIKMLTILCVAHRCHPAVRVLAARIVLSDIKLIDIKLIRLKNDPCTIFGGEDHLLSRGLLDEVDLHEANCKAKARFTEDQLIIVVNCLDDVELLHFYASWRLLENPLFSLTKTIYHSFYVFCMIISKFLKLFEVLLVNTSLVTKLIVDRHQFWLNILHLDCH
nr:MAG TPA: hypothetical protein [Caudoviricetes sp.]